jgi:hypothetical protein
MELFIIGSVSGVIVAPERWEYVEPMSKKKAGSVFESAHTADSDPYSEISRRLRAMYQEVEETVIPDRFLDLLEKLEEAEESQQKEKRR